MVFCRIIGVIMLNLVQKITLKMLCSVPCCEVQQIFFSGFPKEQVQLSKPSIRNKLVLKMVFCRIIVVIISNLIRKITLNLLCSVPCYEVQQIFFSFWTSKGTRSAVKNFNSKEVGFENGICRIIKVIMPNLFPEITVNAHCPFPCWYVYSFFFLSDSQSGQVGEQNFQQSWSWK